MRGHRPIAISLFLALSVGVACDYKPRNQGRALYQKHCQNCHMQDGEGLGRLIPPLAGADYVVEHQEHLACIIRNGISGEIEVNGVVYNDPMAANPRLTEVEVSNLIHYILVDMNNREMPYQISEVRAQLEACK